MRGILNKMRDEIIDFRLNCKDLTVVPEAEPDEIRNYLASKYNLKNPVPIEKVFSDIKYMMRKWNLHVTNPRYFGLFDPQVTLPSIIADTLTALYNPQLASWSHAPAANEIERFTLDFLLKRFGIDTKAGFANFTTGGAESNLTAVLLALTAKFPEYGDKGLRGLETQPVFYVSEETHHSFNKIAHITGLGRDAVRIIEADDNLKMDTIKLEQAVESDIENGFKPFLVVGTAGTTSAGIIDPLGKLADICSRYKLWFHVDAAWGGAAVLVPEYREYFNGIERADSITCDAHKWFSVSMGAGMFFTRDRENALKAFRIKTGYMPDKIINTVDFYASTIQWSRRFIGLKLFMTLAVLGEKGISDMVRKQIILGESLRKRLAADGWIIVNKTPLPLACFTHSRIMGGEVKTSDIIDAVLKMGKSWISETILRGNMHVLRACITNYETTEEDISFLAAQLKEIIETSS